jgi:hypothetical protein
MDDNLEKLIVDIYFEKTLVYTAFNRGNGQMGDSQLNKKSVLLLGVGVGFEIEHSPLLLVFKSKSMFYQIIKNLIQYHNLDFI